MWVNHASRLWLCCAASRTPPPCGPRTTSGTVFLPPSMKRNFAAWLAIMSMVSAMKSKIWISTTGRIPAIAAPTPQPTNVASEIGVSPHPRLAELLHEPCAYREDAAGLADVLAHQEHALVTRHLLAQRLVESLGEAELAGPGRRRRRIVGVRGVDRTDHRIDTGLGAGPPELDRPIELPFDLSVDRPEPIGRPVAGDRDHVREPLDRIARHPVAELILGRGSWRFARIECWPQR